MTTKRTSKTLFKKLSALRACLSDDERALLDKLLLTQLNTTDKGGYDNGNGGSVVTKPDAGHRTNINEQISISFDKDREIYIVD